MNENNQTEKKDMSSANIWIAITLGVFAFLIAFTPFLYLKDATS